MSPQVLTVYEDMLNRGQRMFMGRLLAPDEELGPMFKAFHGRMYMNLSQMRRVCSLIGAPAADMLRSLGHPEEIHPDDERPKRAPLGELLRCLPDFIRLGSYDPRIETLLRRHEERTRQTLARITAADPRSMSDADIWKMVRWWVDDRARGDPDRVPDERRAASGKLRSGKPASSPDFPTSGSSTRTWPPANGR